MQIKHIFQSTALATALFATTIFSANVMGQAAATATKAEGAAKTGATKAKMAMPSASDISDAKAKGMVWVNTNTKVYHTDGEFYGHTKQGKFMMKDDAEKAGYHMAKEPVAKKAKAAVTDATKK